MPLLKIVSGGQTGVDRGALDAALRLGFPCGGFCPCGRLAEDGVIPERYPLSELPDGGYLERTIRNVVESDGTAVLFFGTLEGGTEEAVNQCRLSRKPFMLIDAEELDAAQAAQSLRDFVTAHRIRSLNVAGPRQSREIRAHDYAFEVITLLLQKPQAA
jgi:hypothetical protein